MIYLQRYAETGKIGKEESSVLRHAIMERLPYRFLDESALGELEHYHDLSLFVGSVEGSRLVLNSLGYSLPEPNYYPTELSKFLGREVWTGTSANVVLNMAEGNAIFAKPANKWKLFTGQLFDDTSGYTIIKDVANDEELWLSEPVDFVSEFRAYVADGELLKVCQYEGEEDAEPDLGVINEAIALFAEDPNNPTTYAFDWGYTTQGSFLLVEMNHGFAIGCYSGISDKDYYRFIKAGWLQLTRA